MRDKFGNIKVLLQSIKVSKKDEKKAKVKDIERFVKQIIVEYVQTRKESLNKKRLGF